MASGPSAKKADFKLLRAAQLRDRVRVIAIKESVDLFPTADAVYGCDAHWWRFRRGLPDFKGLKFAHVGSGLAEYPDILGVEVAEGGGRVDKYSDALQLERGTVGGGGNSGFQAVNLAIQFGARQPGISLVGFDLHDAGGKHWYGRNSWPMAHNPGQGNFRRWVAAFEEARQLLEQLGVQVRNASPGSALKSFPYERLDMTLAGI